LQKLFETADPEDGATYEPWWDAFKKMAADSNLVAQEAAITALNAYLQNAPAALAIKCVFLSHSILTMH
jgi:hypothetical protein